MDQQSFVEHSIYERSHWWFVARHRIIERLISRLLHDSIECPTIIEIGCGTGALIDQLSRKFQVVGADISSYAIQIANANYPDRNFKVYGQIDELAEAISQSDVVLLLDVLEHVNDDFEFFSRVAKYISPGSTLLITVPGDPNLWSRHDEALFHFRRYTPQRLSMLWRDLPLKPRLFSGFNWRLAPMIRAVRKIQSFLSRFRSRSIAKKSDLSPLPSVLNQSLLRIFASESGKLEPLIDQVDEQCPPHRSGISLIVALRREVGEISIRKKPAACDPDQHEPANFDLGIVSSTVIHKER